MGLEQIRAGIGLTGSFCSLHGVLDALEQLPVPPELTFVLSYHTQQLSSRFGEPGEFATRLRGMTSHPLVTSIPLAEPLGPKNLLDLFVIAPCTGNSLAKLAAGITDTPVLMAAKGHLRNGKPLLLHLASNDALGLNLKNIGTLLSTKHIFFVPFGQDAPQTKPYSLTSQPALLSAAMEAALRGEQLQPILI